MDLTKGVQTLGLLNELQPKLARLKTATNGFESMFAKQILSEMRKGVKETPLGGDQAGSDTYKDMMDQAVADKVAANGSLGIGKILYTQYAPKMIAIERQHMVRDVRTGTSELPADKRWILGEDGKDPVKSQIKISKTDSQS